MQTDTITVEVLNDFWTYFQAIATGVGALITALTIALVLWQTMLTRRSVMATEASVKATEGALQIARDEYDRNTELIKDGQRARIDAEMPRLAVAVRQASQAFCMLVGQGDFAEDLHVGISTFKLPDDANKLVQIYLKLEVTNDGPISARFDSYQPRNLDEPVAAIGVDVGDTRTVSVTRTETVARWVDLALIYVDGGDGRDGTDSDEVIFGFDYIHPADTGAIEHHQVVQGGSILERVPGTADTWVLAPFDKSRYGGLNAVARPSWRDYYISRSKNLRL